MKILFLGGNMAAPIVEWLEKQGEEVIYTEDKVTVDQVRALTPEFIVSYNFKYLLPKDILEAVNGQVINLHISMLPYNRGAHPNVWSFLEDTPKGVTIHYIDEGIDTGDILAQREVVIDEERETLKSSYEILHREIQTLFIENWQSIKHGKLLPQPQRGKGSIHYLKEYPCFEPYIREQGWETPISELRARYRSGIEENSEK